MHEKKNEICWQLKKINTRYSPTWSIYH